MMTLYHGSTCEIERIDLSKSKPNKDFGRGFYLSREREQALELARYKAFQVGGNPVVNGFEFDETYLVNGLLKVKTFDGYTKEWAEFVFENRNAVNDYKHGYDIVYGPIANDRVGLQIRRYVEKDITFDMFLRRLRYMKGVTFQYYFGTEASVKLLRRV